MNPGWGYPKHFSLDHRAMTLCGIEAKGSTPQAVLHDDPELCPTCLAERSKPNALGPIPQPIIFRPRV